MSKVYITTELSKLDSLVQNYIDIRKDEKAAIKIHMGDTRNYTHVRPEIAKTIYDRLVMKGAEPYLFDTIVCYGGKRATKSSYLELARYHGFGDMAIKIGDEGIKVDAGDKLKKVEVAKEICDADALVVLSHIKGHVATGFGGALKNLGMGAVSMYEKERMHKLPQPKYDPEKCTECGECANNCPFGLIKLVEGRPLFDLKGCFGCGICIALCPAHALVSKSGATLRELIVESAGTVLKLFENKKTYYINVLENITKHCDCAPTSEIICGDIGILFSEDIVSIEKASIDLIAEKTKKNIFKEVNKIDPKEQIDAAVRYGLGSEEYMLVRV